MKKKVIILSPIPLSAKLFSDFYINELRIEGVDVEYWDFSSMFFKHPLKSPSIYNNLVVTISTKKKFVEQLNSNQDNKNILIITGFTFCYKFLFIYRILNCYSFSLAIFARGALPNFGSTKSQKNQILNILTRIFNLYKWRNFLQRLYALILKFIGLTKKIDFVFKAGENGLVTIGSGYTLDVKKAEKIVDINHFDYDKFLLLKNLNLTKKSNNKFIVFLDDYLPFHPDFDLMSMKKVDSVNYYRELNSFFDYIEKLTALKVIIAAHPKANYEVNPFNNRMIYYGQTLEVVTESAFVVGHASSSLSFAVCCKKKIILMTSNDIKSINGGYFHRLIMGFQNVLGIVVVDISHRDFNIQMSNVNLDINRYKKYKYTYLTNNTSERDLSVSIFMNFIRSYKTN